MKWKLIFDVVKQVLLCIDRYMIGGFDVKMN